MPRHNRDMKRISLFVPTQHYDLAVKLASRKGMTVSEFIRALFRKYLKSELEKIQEKKA